MPIFALTLSGVSISCNADEVNMDDGLYADFNTSKGRIIVELFPDKAPLTVLNFVGLAEGSLDFANKDGHFYDGLKFHRVIADFMIQGGDPQGNGTGGPGYQFPDETDNGLLFDSAGILAMANSGPDTNGSQFFITHKNTDWLNGKHTIFGRVVEGQEVVDAVEQGDVIESLTILRIGSEAKKYQAKTEDFNNLKQDISQQRKAAAEQNRKAVRQKIAERWPNAVHDEQTGSYWLIQNEGTGPTVPQGSMVKIHYIGSLLTGNEFDNSRARNEPLEFNAGMGQVIPGMDMQLLQMKKGERRIMILPPEMAYGDKGAGPIAPGSWLVFDVELLDF